MSAGYVKLHRSFLHHDMFRDPASCQFFVYCITSAAYKDRKFLYNKQVVSLKKGQFIYGRKKAAEMLGTTERKVRTLRDMFEKLDFLTIQTTNRYTIITVNNWDTYQGASTENDQPVDQQTTNRRPTDDHIQEGKERKERKESKNSIPAEISAFVDLFQGHITKHHGKKAPNITASKTCSDRETVDKIVRLDGFDLETIKVVMRWALKDDFWSDQVLSLGALRRKKDGLTKFQTIYARWERDTQKPIKASKKRRSEEFEQELLNKMEGNDGS